MSGGKPDRASRRHSFTAARTSPTSATAWLIARVLVWLLAPWIVLTSLAPLTIGHLPSSLSDNALFAQGILAIGLSALLGWVSLWRSPQPSTDAPRLPLASVQGAFRLTGVLSGLTVSLAFAPYLLGILAPITGDAWLRPAVLGAIWLSPIALVATIFATFFLRCAACGRRALTVMPATQGAACHCRRCGAHSVGNPE